MNRIAWIAAALATTVSPLAAPDCDASSRPGHLVGLSVEIDGQPAPLYPAPDGARRWYLEASRGSSYAVRLQNHTRERLGVELSVDGLDVISGVAPPPGGRGRLYILSPGGSALVRGWRTSLEAVQRFEFVEEERSYAVRAGRSGARLGWIEARVFREQPAVEVEQRRPQASGPPAAEADRAEATGEGRSHPGTGWGRRLGDRAVLVDFRAQPAPAETVTLRYEYTHALRVLGVLPRCHTGRLWERERGETGFARPPDDHR